MALTVRILVRGRTVWAPSVALFGRPEQLVAWRENRPYVADVTA
ncbi:hypothetical protein [Streptomyces sp. NPDC101165]